MGLTARTILLFVLCSSSSNFGYSQDLQAQGEALVAGDSEFTIATRVDEVNLILSVTDSKGRFVSDLGADDLQVLDNHQSPGKWNYFQARTDLPLRVVLAVDISSSIRDRFRFEQQAASSFLKHVLRPKTDEAAVVAFGSEVLDKTETMTSDVGKLDAAINALQPGGETAMYDAIIASCHKLRQSRAHAPARPVIILITDGADTASKASLRAAEEAATRAEAVIFALDANIVSEKNSKGRRVLEQLTRATGGFILPAREKSELKDAFRTVERVLRNQYALGYPPPDLQANGRFRSIEVTARKHGLKVHAREGYYAPRESTPASPR